MARRLLLLLLCDCGFVVLLPARASAAAQPERCSMPKEVSNAEIKVDNNNFLNARLRYKCKEGYKRKAGTSSLIVCERDNATKMLRWTEPNITCIRDPSLPPSTSSPRQTTSASRTEPTSPVSEESKAFTPSKQPVTRVTSEISTVRVTASTPAYERETTSPLAGPSSQLRTDKPSWGTLATTPAEIRSSEAPASESTEGTAQQHTTAGQDTHTSQLWTEKPLLETVATEGDGSTAVPANVTTGNSTELPTAGTHNTKVSTHVMLSSVGFPVFLVMAAVVFCCLWRQRVHRRQQYALPLIAIPTTEGEAEQRHGTPSEDNNLNSPDQTTEGTEMMSSFCGTPTG